MTYAERLTEFVRVTGHKPGEVNKSREGGSLHGSGESRSLTRDSREETGTCSMLTRSTPLETPRPCKLIDGHHGPHQP